MYSGPALRYVATRHEAQGTFRVGMGKNGTYGANRKNTKCSRLNRSTLHQNISVRRKYDCHLPCSTTRFAYLGCTPASMRGLHSDQQFHHTRRVMRYSGRTATNSGQCGGCWQTHLLSDARALGVSMSSILLCTPRMLRNKLPSMRTSHLPWATSSAITCTREGWFSDMPHLPHLEL